MELAQPAGFNAQIQLRKVGVAIIRNALGSGAEEVGRIDYDLRRARPVQSTKVDLQLRTLKTFLLFRKRHNDGDDWRGY